MLMYASEISNANEEDEDYDAKKTLADKYG